MANAVDDTLDSVKSWLKYDVNPPTWEEGGYVKQKNYQIRIYSDQGAAIIANMPEQIQLNVGSQWNQPFSNQSLSGRLTDNKLISAKTAKGVDTISSVIPMTTQLKVSTVSVWQSGTQMELQIPLVFRATENSVFDVTNNIVELMRMAVPSEMAGVLIAPGPSIAGNALKRILGYEESSGSISSGLQHALSGETIVLQLGSFIEIQPVIISNVGSEMFTQYDINGNPMSATVNVTFQTPYVVTKSDIVDFFRNCTIAR